jgi:FkbM family methyltransferase
MKWDARVAWSRWTHRFTYLARAPLVYRNWWAMALPKLGFATVLQLRDGRRYRVRPGTLDLSVINETAFLNPYLSNGFVSLASDSVVVDIGANVGDFAIQAARLCPDGRVIAVEPACSAGGMIEQQARLNGVSNVGWIRAAIGASDSPTASRRPGNPYARSDADLQCPTMTLDRLAAEHHLDRIDLLKLDCEGAEWEILPSSEHLLPKVRQICMEYHSEGDWTGEKLAEWLKTLGFEVIYTPGSWNGLLWARRRLL